MTTKTSSLLDAIQTPVSPFPGLRPFESNENDLFFGRDEQTEKMMDKLAVTRFLAVVGTSGSGKSSLVRAGMMPALHSGMMAGAGSKWRIAVMRPSNDPIGNLARALNAPEVFGSDDAENQTIQIAIAEATLRLGSRGLIEAVCQNLMPQTENLLVVVDQFEELFRFAREARKAKDERYDNDAAAFVKLLLESVKPEQRPSDNGANIYVVLTMRSDFLGDCSQFWDLPEAINESQYLIPRLTRDQLREVIEGPVAVGGGQIAPRLVNQLLNDITDNQDQLPILQHALMRTWDEWKHPQHEHQALPGVIDLCCYEATGGMAEALSRHADEAYNELDEPHRKIAEKMFKALTEKGEDNREIRRPVTLSELCAVTGATAAEVIAVIETFRAPGRSFLMPPADVPLNADSLIDISHESLIRNWQRLSGWVDEEAASSREYLRLVDTATRFREGRESVLRDSGLQTALDWRDKQMPNQDWAQRYHTDFAPTMNFLDESRAAREADVKRYERLVLEAEEKRKRELRRTRIIAAVLLAAFLFSLASAGVAWQQRAVARTQKGIAEDATRKAEEKTKQAEASAKEARKQTEIAQAATAEAEKKTEEAKASADRATKQTEIAQAATAKAEKKTEEAKVSANKATEQAKIAEEQKIIADAQRGIAEKKTDEAEASAIKATGQAKIADEQKQLAEVARRSAEEQRQLAETNQRKAAEESEKSRHLYYAASMNLARSEFDNNNHSRGYELLESFLPQSETEKANDDRSFYWYYLWKHNFAEMATLKGHTGEVTSVAFSSDGKTLATSSEDKTVKLWDVASRQELATLKGRTGEGFFLAVLSSDGKMLATGSEDETVKQVTVEKVTVKLWDVANPKEPKELATLKGYGAVAFSGDSKTLATGSTDGTVKLWDVASPKEPKELATLKGHTDIVRSVAFSSDGKTLATGSEDKTVKLWDVASPKEAKLLATLTCHTKIVYSVAFSSDSKTLATGSEDGTVMLWDVASPKEPKELATLTSHTYREIVFSVAFSSDGKTLATGIARFGQGGVVKLWDVASRQELATLTTVHRGELIPVAFSSDGKTLATGSGYKEVGEVKLWDVASRHELATPTGTSVAFSSDGKTLATGSEDNTVKLWDVASRQESATLKGHTEIVRSVAFSSDGKTLATGSEDGTVKLWDVASPKEPKLLATLKAHTEIVRSVAFSRDSKTLATGSDGTVGKVKLWDVASPKEPKLLATLPGPEGGSQERFTSVAFSSDGRTLATSSYYNTVDLVKLWDVASPKEPKLLATLKGHTGRVESVAFSNDGKTLATGSGDNTVGEVKLWDVASPKEPKLLATLKGHTESVRSVAFSSDDKTLATGSGDKMGGAVKLWDVASWQELATLKGHTENVSSVAFSSDGRTLMTGSWDNTVKLYTGATEEEVRAQRSVKQEAAKPAGKQ